VAATQALHPPSVDGVILNAKEHVMKRLLLAAAIVCIGAVTAAADRARADSAGRTLDLRGTITSFRLAAGHKPSAPGDLGYISGVLSRAGKPAGRFTGVCAQVDAAHQQCTFVLGLPEGQIVATSAYGPGLNVGAVAHEAIVGGTGAYEGARGQGDDREVGSRGLILHLRLLR
jgi:hypothetical protein